jgi:hypothetical protein
MLTRPESSSLGISRPHSSISAAQQRTLKTIDVEGGLQLRDETPPVMDSGRPTRVSQDWMTKKAARSDQNEPRFFLTRSAWHPGVGAALVGPKDPSGLPASQDAESETVHCPALGPCRRAQLDK